MRTVLLAVMLLAAGICPAFADAKADARKAEIDAMLTALAKAPDEQTATSLETRIKQLWFDSGSPVATLLMGRGMRNLQNNAADDAVQDFDAVVVLEPDMTEAYERRAVARYSAGDYKGALIDIEITLQREPRHFAALQTLSRIAEAQGDAKGALNAWMKVLELDPKTPGGEQRRKDLTRKVEGERI
jgi:tetratricopeptide (TPR) repeat protein